MPTPETNNSRIAVDVEKLVYGGDGLARLEGQVVLTPFVLPGERAHVEPVQQKTGLIRARMVEIENPAEARVEPDCPYFTVCGGCHYQHANYEFQVQQKAAILREVFERVGKFHPPDEIPTISGEPWQYRNRSQFHFADGELGYLRINSHELCPIDHCPISSPRINEGIKALRSMMKERRWPSFLRRLELFTNERDVQVNVLDTQQPLARSFFEWCSERIPGAISGSIQYDAAGFSYRVGYKAFFQVNRFLTDALVEEALRGYGGDSALDLYAGVGLFTLPLARKFGRVTGVEGSAAAAGDLQHNAERAGLNINVVHAPTDTFLANTREAPDFLLADPPRSGMGKAVVAGMLRLRPRRITIVSCDAATLARDVAKLLADGYSLNRLVLVDLFPQTYHFEAVAHLTLG
jgi:23S rRNA (uracil1939-C5)-methyltransferase